MSNDSFKVELDYPEPPVSPRSKIKRVPWNPWLGVAFIAGIYYLSTQYVGAVIVYIYPWLSHWTTSQTNDWLNSSILAQFVYVLSAESFMLVAIYVFLNRYKTNFKLIGLTGPKLRDIGLGLLAAPLYYAVYVVVVYIISHFVHSLNINQVQNIGFTGVTSNVQLIMTFISLVILPPLVEEIIFRGFLYSSLKKAMPKVAAVVVASLIFASAHLPEGGVAGPLYIAALDTFILSLFLIYLRERTGNLWSSMTLHGLKNGVAFLVLFVFNIH